MSFWIPVLLQRHLPRRRTHHQCFPIVSEVRLAAGTGAATGQRVSSTVHFAIADQEIIPNRLWLGPIQLEPSLRRGSNGGSRFPALTNYVLSVIIFMSRSKSNHRGITPLGSCIVTKTSNLLRRFHPLVPPQNEFVHRKHFQTPSHRLKRLSNMCAGKPAVGRLIGPVGFGLKNALPCRIRTGPWQAAERATLAPITMNSAPLSRTMRSGRPPLMRTWTMTPQRGLEADRSSPVSVCTTDRD